MKSCLAAAFAVLVTSTGVFAQPQIGSYTPPQVNPHPTISPFLNLNRSGVSPGVNYFGIVRPQMENQQAIQQLQQFQKQFPTTQGQTGQLPNEEMAPTGHVAGGFFNYGHYYPLFTRGGTAATGGVRR